MTNSEKLLSSFSENYFYKELVYADLKFTPIGGTEIELADLIINLEDIILAIQLKERNEKDRTQDKNIEEKWLKKKCKKAKEQIKDTISYITSEKVSFINARGKKTIINPNAEVVPLVVFENDSISEYEHLLRNHTNDGLAVNCMSIYDFKLMCKQLLSPIEIIEYLKWREVFYKNNGPINLLITETNNGFVLSKPQKNENLVQQYLYEKYGENAIYEDRLYYELFRQYVLVLYEHKEIESEINGCYEVIKFLAHLFRDEIKCFVERTEKALLIAKTKKFNLVGTLRNVQKEYAIVFTATEQIPCIVSKKVAEYFEENVLQCGLTYSGHTLACAAGVAAMKYYKEHDIEGHVAEMHEIVAPFMDEMVKKHKCIGEARCIGLFGALEVVKNKETREPMQEYGVPGPVMPWIFAELKKRGFATFGRENFIEICPPLIITKEELEEYLPILDEVLTMVDEKFCD